MNRCEQVQTGVNRTGGNRVDAPEPSDSLMAEGRGCRVEEYRSIVVWKVVA